MDQERIKALIGLLAESDLIELSLTEGDSTLRLFKEAAGNVVEAPLRPARVATDKAASVSAPVREEIKLEVKASLYGVLHLTPAVDEAPFVQVGDSVEAGQTLAIIEAMKMFHPLKASRPGIVEAILVDGGTEVEAGQPLFRIG
ncbi:acetyl-CoA carboxylase biotin carboxyl carrier protein subunit [Pseudomonas cichorii]|uniref:acetyl-CoA carboxylase biotin carboxyl carrier protein n=1 Tax=Pseudomonas cichorii TaxID=36746 RepID=UPI0018E5BF21|nr:acetyl-CoA carboxylase biotin carboxyl carrier protein subunit [Pseudomonas cichorii]MBI6854227.1 acetyl-CoA carboxylase biotin carboxyl carrier protein subunit [Pseudomonas cichorii]